MGVGAGATSTGDGVGPGVGEGLGDGDGDGDGDGAGLNGTVVGETRGDEGVRLPADGDPSFPATTGLVL